MMTRRIPPRDLREIWSQIPSIKCAGKCANSCGPIECTSLERRLIEDRAGKRLEAKPPGPTCSMLRHGRCSVYSIRPVICRLWGVVESMPCPWGCKPERTLTDREGMTLMLKAMEIAGDNPENSAEEFMDSLPQEVIDKMREWALGAPDLAGAIRNRPKANEEFLESVRRHGLA